MKYLNKKLRHEYKYFINMSDYYYLRNKLNGILNMDENAAKRGGYHIRSLYFDNIYNSLYADKESGVFQRKKYRIRIYDKSDVIIKLELKEKFDKYTSKKSATISKELYYKIIDNTLTINDVSHDELLLKFYIEVKANLLKPSVIVDYFREPYVYKSGNVRVTFDRELKAVIDEYDIFMKDLQKVTPLNKGEMILEVKYDDYMPKFIDELLELKYHNLSSASKYTICRTAKNNLSWKENIV